MGVMGRANQKLGGGGDWLDKDELIRLRVPLAIVNIALDRTGTAKFPGENWIVTLEPWEPDKFPGPSGSVRFKNLPTRQAQFEDIAEQLDDAKERGEPYIGPVAMVSGTSKGGNRFKTLADVLTDTVETSPTYGEILVDAKGFPRIDGEAEPTPPPAPAPVPGPRRPTGSVAQQSVGQRERAAAPAPAPAPAAQAPAPTAEPEPAPAAATPVPARRRGRPPAAAADPAAPVSTYEAQQQAQAATEPIGPPPSQPELAQVIPMATATCPFCQTEVGPNRVYPAQGGGHVIMHAHCPVKQDTVILPVMLEEGAA